MDVSVIAGGLPSEPFKMTTDVKKGGLVAPTLFSIFLSVFIFIAFTDCLHRFRIRYRTSIRLFNLGRQSAFTRTFQTLLRNLLYADNFHLLSDNEEEMQILMDSISLKL